MIHVLLYFFNYITTRFIIEIQFPDLKLKTVYHAVIRLMEKVDFNFSFTKKQ